MEVVGLFSLGTDFANDANLFMSERQYVEAVYPPIRQQQALEQIDMGLIEFAHGADRRKSAGAIASHVADRRQGDDQGSSSSPANESSGDPARRSVTCSASASCWDSSSGSSFATRFCTPIFPTICANTPRLKPWAIDLDSSLGSSSKRPCCCHCSDSSPRCGLSELLYRALASTTGLLLHLTVERAAIVLGMTIAMCVVSGLLTIRKVLSADPAELFA